MMGQMNAQMMGRMTPQHQQLLMQQQQMMMQQMMMQQQQMGGMHAGSGSMGAQQHMGILGQMPGCMHMGMPSHGGQMQGGQAQILPGLTQDMLQELMTDDVKLQNFLTENPTMMEEILKLL